MVRNKTAAERLLLTFGLKLSHKSEIDLEIDHFIWDSVYPLFIFCLPNDPSAFAKSKLILSNFLIIQVSEENHNHHHNIILL